MKTALEQMIIDLDNLILGDLKLTTKDIWNETFKSE